MSYKLLYIPIETKDRELLGKLLLAAAVAGKGWFVFFGHQAALRKVAPNFLPGIFSQISIPEHESTLLSGFYMIVDGRSNNARFLQRMLKRDYEVKYHENADVTTFELLEPRLGRKNIYGWEAYN